MKLIIDIDETEYSMMKTFANYGLGSKAIDIILSGIPLDKIRAEIEEQVLESLSDGGDDWFAAEKVNECLEIIDKYKAESEENKSCDTYRWNKTDKCQPSTCAMIGCDGHGLWEMAESEE